MPTYEPDLTSKTGSAWGYCWIDNEPAPFSDITDAEASRVRKPVKLVFCGPGAGHVTQLFKVQRFGDEIVHAGIDTFIPIFCRCIGSHREDWQVYGDESHFPYFSGGVDAVHPASGYPYK